MQATKWAGARPKNMCHTRTPKVKIVLDPNVTLGDVVARTVQLVEYAPHLGAHGDEALLCWHLLLILQLRLGNLRLGLPLGTGGTRAT